MSADRLREALQNLCDKLDKVTEDTKDLFVLAYAHGQMYQGANYAAELKAAKAALAASDAPAPPKHYIAFATADDAQRASTILATYKAEQDAAAPQAGLPSKVGDK